MWGIMALCVAAFAIEIAMPEQKLARAMMLFGIVPRRFTDPAWAAGVGFPSTYWGFLTSMFLHGGWLHIISNLWILWIFGDNVEDRMGPLRFLLFYLFCGAASGIAHTLANPASQVPAIGASGAIAGVLAAYMLLFPLAQVVCLVPIFFYPLFIQVPAYFFILIWFGLQFASGAAALLSPDEVAGVAWWAHIGGFAAGLLTFRLFLIRQPKRRPLFPDEHGIEGAWHRR